MKLVSENKKYNIKHIPNVSGHPQIDITSPEPSSITSDSFTVVLPSCCMLPYKCNDVIYDVKGKTTDPHPSMDWMVQTYFIVYVDKSTVFG